MIGVANQTPSSGIYTAASTYAGSVTNNQTTDSLGSILETIQEGGTLEDLERMRFQALYEWVLKYLGEGEPVLEESEKHGFFLGVLGALDWVKSADSAAAAFIDEEMYKHLPPSMHLVPKDKG